MRTLRLVESSEETNEHSWRESGLRGLEVGIVAQVITNVFSSEYHRDAFGCDGEKIVVGDQSNVVAGEWMEIELKMFQFQVLLKCSLLSTDESRMPQ